MRTQALAKTIFPAFQTQFLLHFMESAHWLYLARIPHRNGIVPWSFWHIFHCFFNLNYYVKQVSPWNSIWPSLSLLHSLISCIFKLRFNHFDMLCASTSNEKVPVWCKHSVRRELKWKICINSNANYHASSFSFSNKIKHDARLYINNRQWSTGHGFIIM